VRFLAVIRLPHRNDVSIRSAWRPHHDNHVATQKADRHDADFSVVSPGVFTVECLPGEDLFRMVEIEPTLP
jgi:hypothetical protein